MKKDVIALSELIKEKGYWSNEVFNFNNALLEKYKEKYTVSRIEVSAKLMLQTGVYKLVNP